MWATGRRTLIPALVLGAVACGDNASVAIGPALEPARSLFVIAHFDDDMIFMQPELHAALATGSVTTVYVTSGDPLHGDGRAELTFDAAMTAYASAAGSSDWDCGYIVLRGGPAHHCRLRDRPVSMIGLDVVDGGIEGQDADSPLHLMEHQVPSLPILGPIGGRATTDTIVDSLAEILTATAPDEIHALDLAATHGRDHSSHLFTSSFLFWAAAHVGYAGAIRWHRGYNVESEAVTLGDADFATVEPMLGYFEACYFGCGPCGTSCATLDSEHDTWLHRQYSSTRVPTATGTLANEAGSCMTATAAGLALADCAGAPQVELAADGHLTIGDRCLASTPTAVIAEACEEVASQYWLLDSEGALWNGSPPDAVSDMDYDHVRCLSDLTAPTCGEHVHPHWHFH